ncbi:Armadillo repeat-containing protein 2 [Lamellibrachia satsuma]|nr:Armadillo repeat-containing protein 2 [Lamellibrachia satsuma]
MGIFYQTGSTNTSLDARTTPPAQHNIEDPKDTGTNNPEPPMVQTDNRDARNTNGHQVSGEWEVETLASLPSEESGRLRPLPPSPQRRVEVRSSEKSVATHQEDVLVKVIRVIANISMNPEVGPSITAHEPCILLLIEILEHKTVETGEEVILNTMTTINNLSFYVCHPSAIIKHQLQLAHALLKFLEAKNMAGLAEATRVFGNLSREVTVRDFLAKHKVDEALVAMLDSDKVEVVFTACGVLINLMADEDKRPTLKKMDGIRKLTDVLRDWGPQDWQLASMVCQTLWNFSGKITSTNACFGEKEAHDLSELLLEYLDMDTPGYKDCDSAMKQYLHEVWQSDFVPVATQLLNRIESHQSNFEILENPS